LPVIWGGGEPEFKAEAEMRTALGAIMSRYNEIITCLGPLRHGRLTDIVETRLLGNEFTNRRRRFRRSHATCSHQGLLRPIAAIQFNPLSLASVAVPLRNLTSVA
jgi:hypothetical protein